MSRGKRRTRVELRHLPRVQAGRHRFPVHARHVLSRLLVKTLRDEKLTEREKVPVLSSGHDGYNANVSVTTTTAAFKKA